MAHWFVRIRGDLSTGTLDALAHAGLPVSGVSHGSGTTASGGPPPPIDSHTVHVEADSAADAEARVRAAMDGREAVTIDSAQPAE